MFKLLALDIDGTLIKDNDEMTQAVKQAVFRAKNKGVKIVLLSGRNYLGMKPYVDALKLEGTMVSANGTVVVNSKTSEVTYQIPMDKCTALEFAKEGKNKGFIIVNMSGYTIYTEDFCHAPDDVKNFMHFDFEIVDDILKCIEEQQVNKISLVGSREELILFREKNLHKYEDGYNMDFGMEHSLEIYSSHAGKGKALEHVANEFGIKKNEIICIGDSENDIDMFKYSGMSVAMGNAHDIVKNNADYVTKPVDQDGAAFAINKFIL